MTFFSPQHASGLMNQARDLVARGVWRIAHIAVCDFLTFRARPHGRDRCQVSYSNMARALHMRRETLVEVIGDLESAGLIRKVRTRVRVAWQGLWASRQGTNIYVFSALRTEFRGRTPIRVEVKKEASGGANRQIRALSAGITDLSPIGERSHPGGLEAALARLGGCIG